MKRLAIVGLPNTGKSTFFNRLTGASAKVGNWPGITVELYSARITLGAEAVEVVDLPGIYNLHGFSEDEKVARRFLEQTPLHLLAVIVNATQLDRQLGLALQAKELGIPMVLHYFIIFNPFSITECEKFLEEFVARDQRESIRVALDQIFVDGTHNFIVVDKHSTFQEKFKITNADRFFHGEYDQMMFNKV